VEDELGVASIGRDAKHCMRDVCVPLFNCIVPAESV
jgi:hypothetical protein